MRAYKTVIARRFEDGTVEYYSIHTHLRDCTFKWDIGRRIEAQNIPFLLNGERAFLTACTIPEAALHYAQSYVAPEDGIALFECDVDVLKQEKHELTCSAITPLWELPFLTYMVHKLKGDGPHVRNALGERVERWFLPWPER